MLFNVDNTHNSDKGEAVFTRPRPIEAALTRTRPRRGRCKAFRKPYKCIELNSWGNTNTFKLHLKRIYTKIKFCLKGCTLIVLHIVFLETYVVGRGRKIPPNSTMNVFRTTPDLDHVNTIRREISSNCEVLWCSG